MTRDVKKHYENIADVYDDLWIYSDDFVNEISRKIAGFLHLEKTDRLVDLGCGTGIYSKSILHYTPIENPVICVDLSEKMLENVKGIDKMKPMNYGAIEFSELNLSYNKIFIKEMIHHIADSDKNLLFNNIFQQLEKGGLLLVMLLPPTIDYPLFDKAKEMYESQQPHYRDLSSMLKIAGFDVTESFIEYELDIDKEKYFNMVRSRYMSLLSLFSDEEIENGITEMEEKYKSVESLKFPDRFVCLISKKQ